MRRALGVLAGVAVVVLITATTALVMMLTMPKPAPPAPPAPLPVMGVCVDMLPYEEAGMTAVQSVSSPTMSGGVLTCPVGAFVPVRAS